MKKLINGLTGTVMWVADDRVEEYKAAGHVPAEDAEKPEPKKAVRKAKR